MSLIFESRQNRTLARIACTIAKNPARNGTLATCTTKQVATTFVKPDQQARRILTLYLGVGRQQYRETRRQSSVKDHPRRNLSAITTAVFLGPGFTSGPCRAVWGSSRVLASKAMTQRESCIRLESIFGTTTLDPAWGGGHRLVLPRGCRASHRLSDRSTQADPGDRVAQQPIDRRPNAAGSGRQCGVCRPSSLSPPSTPVLNQPAQGLIGGGTESASRCRWHR